MYVTVNSNCTISSQSKTSKNGTKRLQGKIFVFHRRIIAELFLKVVASHPKAAAANSKTIQKSETSSCSNLLKTRNIRIIAELFLKVVASHPKAAAANSKTIQKSETSSCSNLLKTRNITIATKKGTEKKSQRRKLCLSLQKTNTQSKGPTRLPWGTKIHNSFSKK